MSNVHVSSLCPLAARIGKCGPDMQSHHLVPSMHHTLTANIQPRQEAEVCTLVDFVRTLEKRGDSKITLKHSLVISIAKLSAMRGASLQSTVALGG